MDGVGASSSTARNNVEEAVCNIELKKIWDEHFNRLPSSYRKINMDKVEQVLLHRQLLKEAEDPNNRPACHIRLLETSDTKNDNEGHQNAGKRLRVKDPRPIREVIVSNHDEPKNFLGQISSWLFIMELKVLESHIYTTADGYYLYSFVVVGRPDKGVASLYESLKRAFTAKPLPRAAQVMNPNQQQTSQWRLEDDGTLSNLLATMTDYSPTIFDERVKQHFARRGIQCSDARIVRLLAVATHKFLSQVMTDAIQLFEASPSELLQDLQNDVPPEN